MKLPRTGHSNEVQPCQGTDRRKYEEQTLSRLNNTLTFTNTETKTNRNRVAAFNRWQKNTAGGTKATRQVCRSIIVGLLSEGLYDSNVIPVDRRKIQEKISRDCHNHEAEPSRSTRRRRDGEQTMKKKKQKKKTPHMKSLTHKERTANEESPCK